MTMDTEVRLLRAGDLPEGLRKHIGQPLTDYQSQIMANNVKLGWEPEPSRTFGDECALMHSEVAEAFEAWREHGFADMTRQFAPGSVGAMDAAGQPPKPEGVGSELADVVIRVLHYAAMHGIDVEAEMLRKMRYNESRAWRHGGKAL